jgi:lipid II:glycine glycyltransferase (peptidoglycan interpeptide bridge formation enzyme)
VIRIEGRAVTYGELWFDEELDHSSPVDVLICRHRRLPMQTKTCSPISTLVNDLAADESELLRRFGSTTRYEINRAQNKDGLDASLISPSASAISVFLDFYDTFAQQKSLPRAYRRELFAASATQQLVLTRASCADEVLVWHAYIVWRTSAALLYSASHFRHRSGAQRALVGRANRWLHWKDMLHFKRIGFKHYDWGGLFDDESSADRAGINGFKRDFGGERIAAYNWTMPLTLKGRLYLAGRAILDRVQQS